MDPIEEAEAFRRYIVEFGWGGVKELAKKIGKSEGFVSHRLQLLKLPNDLQQEILLNRINVSQAIELTTLPSSRQFEILQQIIDNDLSVKEIRDLKSSRSDPSKEEVISDHEKSLAILVLDIVV